MKVLHPDTLALAQQSRSRNMNRGLEKRGRKVDGAFSVNIEVHVIAPSLLGIGAKCRDNYYPAGQLIGSSAAIANTGINSPPTLRIVFLPTGVPQVSDMLSAYTLRSR